MKDEKPEPAAPKLPQIMHRILKPGYKMHDGICLQKETTVEYVERDGCKVIVGPANLRPPLLLGSVLMA